MPCVAEVVNRSLKADCTDFSNTLHIKKVFPEKRFCVRWILAIFRDTLKITLTSCLEKFNHGLFAIKTCPCTLCKEYKNTAV